MNASTKTISATFQHGNREATVTVAGTSEWAKSSMKRVYVELSCEGVKLAPIDKLYEVIEGGTKDATIQVAGRTFGYSLGISCDSKTKRTAAVEAIEKIVAALVEPEPVAQAQSEEVVSVASVAEDEAEDEADVVYVALTDGTVGEVIEGVPEVGAWVEVRLQDENGLPMEASGTVAEVL